MTLPQISISRLLACIGLLSVAFGLFVGGWRYIESPDSHDYALLPWGCGIVVFGMAVGMPFRRTQKGAAIALVLVLLAMALLWLLGNVQQARE